MQKRGISRTSVSLFIILGALAMLLATSSYSQQQNIDPPRVNLDFRCPAYPLPGNHPITLYAEIMGARKLLDPEMSKRIKFKWELDGASLVSGQGTQRIVFNSLRSGNAAVNVVTVKLEMENAPPELPVEPTCVVKVESGCQAPELKDQYSGIPIDEEERHLDLLADYLMQTRPGAVSYIVSYMGRTACIWEAEWRAKRAKKYLEEKWNIPSERIVEIDGGARDHWSVDLFVQTHGTCGPILTPTVGRDDVVMRGMCPNWTEVFR